MCYALQQLIQITRVRLSKQGPGGGGSAGAGAGAKAGAGAGKDGSSGKSSLWQPAPHPDWKPPQKQPAPFGTDEMHTVDPAQLPADVMYPLVISAVVPRPIGACLPPRAPASMRHFWIHLAASAAFTIPAGQLSASRLAPSRTHAACVCAGFVSTQSGAGVGNLAPYSYFNVMAHNPPTVAIGCSTSRLRSHGKKDTLVNILETGWASIVGGGVGRGLYGVREGGCRAGCGAAPDRPQKRAPCSAAVCVGGLHHPNHHPLPTCQPALCVQPVCGQHHERVVCGGSQPLLRQL